MAKAKSTPKRKSKPKPDHEALSRDSDIEKIRVTKDIFVPADTDELGRLSLQHADVTLKIEKLETELAEYAAGIRKKLRDLRKEDRRLAKAVQSRTVVRAVELLEVRDYKLNQVRYVDPKDESRELAPAEAMPAEMRQRTIFDEPPTGPRVDVDEEEEPEF